MNKILGLSWNQDNSCFACAHENGYRVFGTDPMVEKVHKVFAEGGFSSVEMLYTCNYIALIGGGKRPCFPTNKVVIWDDVSDDVICSVSFKSEVKTVRLRRDRLIVVTLNRSYIYTLTKTPKKLQEYATIENPQGVCALSASATHPMVAFLGLNPGQVQLVDLSRLEQLPLIVAAHATAIACTAINQEGTLLATASKRGTLIRVFECASGKKVFEVRRGSEAAHITSISFSPDSTLLCAASDHATVHIFSLTRKQEKASGLSTLLPDYFSSQWSFAKFTVSSPSCICAFSAPDQVTAIGYDGNVFRARFTNKGVEAVDQSNLMQFVYDGGESDLSDLSTRATLSHKQDRSRDTLLSGEDKENSASREHFVEKEALPPTSSHHPSKGNVNDPARITVAQTSATILADTDEPAPPQYLPATATSTTVEPRAHDTAPIASPSSNGSVHSSAGINTVTNRSLSSSCSSREDTGTITTTATTTTTTTTATTARRRQMRQ